MGNFKKVAKRMTISVKKRMLPLSRETARRISLLTSGSFRYNTEQSGLVTLARIIGNDLYPRHASGQAILNLDYILKNEPIFPGCRKVFVLNRLFDHQIAEAAKQRILDCGHEVICIPFEPSEYAHRGLDLSAVEIADLLKKKSDGIKYESISDAQRIWACRKKIDYAMNINGARNMALDDGRKFGDWTILLDGSCFVTSTAFRSIKCDLTSIPLCRYLVIPMIRVTSNEKIENGPITQNWSEEPQLAFHCSAQERFDTHYPYGWRDKTSLLDRIGVPGPWSFWETSSGMKHNVNLPRDRHQYKYASSGIYRLTSGIDEGVLEAEGSKSRRYQARNVAIFSTLSNLDEIYDGKDASILRKICNIN